MDPDFVSQQHGTTIIVLDNHQLFHCAEHLFFDLLPVSLPLNNDSATWTMLTIDWTDLKQGSFSGQRYLPKRLQAQGAPVAPEQAALPPKPTVRGHPGPQHFISSPLIDGGYVNFGAFDNLERHLFCL